MFRTPHHLFSILVVASMAILPGGCQTEVASNGEFEVSWGRRGITDGRLQKPRAMAIDASNRLYIVDMMARIQIFNGEGELLARPWQTPEFANGKPTGMTVDHNGNLMVADTHYYRILFYDPDGKLLEEKTIGGKAGQGPGEFGLVTDVVQDSEGNYYVSEYGDFDRIQKFSPEGDFVAQWGGHGSEVGQFRRPQNMFIDQRDQIWVADACNHRIQIFNTKGHLIKIWGEQGPAQGQLSYPYDLVVDEDYVWICEYGNNRIQKFTHDGKSVGCWGSGGRGECQLHNPWALARNSDGQIFVLDTNNHRVQRIRM
ncbi:MAG: NHL repeat-containing protein [Planctomycetales bacterium]